MIALSAGDASDSMEGSGVVGRLLKGTPVADIVESVKRAADAEMTALAAEIHPSVLAAHGLTVALQALARDSAITVVAPSTPVGRLALATEYGISFHGADVVCLAALCLGEHASVAMELAEHDGRIRCSLEVEGADTDLAAFSDEVARIALSDPIIALGGTVRVDPDQRGGIRVVAELPASSTR